MKITTKKKTTTVEDIDVAPSLAAAKTEVDIGTMSLQELITFVGLTGEHEEALNALLQEQEPYRELKKLQGQVSEATKALIAKMEDNVADDEEVTEVYGVFAAHLTQRAIKREIPDMLEVAKALDGIKEGLAIELASFKISDLQKHLTGAQQDDLIKEPREGNRKFKVERIA